MPGEENHEEFGLDFLLEQPKASEKYGPLVKETKRESPSSQSKKDSIARDDLSYTKSISNFSTNSCSVP
jgi:hypothetical protein